MQKSCALVLLLCAIACGSHKEDVPEPTATVEDTARLYLELGRAVQGTSGFIDAESCDSVLFSGLAGAAGMPVDLLAARNDNLRWERRPTSFGSCLSSGESKSTVSRDMLLGVLWWAWRERQLAVAEELLAAALRDDLVVGEWDGSVEGFSRVVVTPGLLGTMAQVVYALGGSDVAVRHVPISTIPVPRGYQRHLHALHLRLRHEAGDEISDSAKETLRTYEKEDPNNPLFPAVLGDAPRVSFLLTKLWPSDRLPTSEDWCESWRIQRADDDLSLNPCQEGKTHSGADFLFVYSLLTWRKP
jgi:hypothetical protein